jgi:hypothetical protein
VTLQKKISHPSLVIYVFSTPPKKTETGIANRWGTNNSKPLGLINMMGHSDTLSSSNHVIFIILFSAGAMLAAPFTSHGELCNYAELKTIFLNRTGMV